MPFRDRQAIRSILEMRGKFPEGGDEPSIVQHGGPEFVGEAALPSL